MVDFDDMFFGPRDLRRIREMRPRPAMPMWTSYKKTTTRQDPVYHDGKSRPVSEGTGVDNVAGTDGYNGFRTPEEAARYRRDYIKERGVQEAVKRRDEDVTYTMEHDMDVINDLTKENKGLKSDLEDLKTRLKDSEDRLKQVEQDRDSYKAALQQERSDFVNYRNRTASLEEDSKSTGVMKAVQAILPALQDFDRMREDASKVVAKEVLLKMVDKLENELKSLGVEKYGEKGDDFDPNIHDALLHNPSGHDGAIVVDKVVSSGWKLGGKTIDAARVVTTERGSEVGDGE